jgi:hypothetical protein
MGFIQGRDGLQDRSSIRTLPNFILHHIIDQIHQVRCNIVVQMTPPKLMVLEIIQIVGISVSQ